MPKLIETFPLSEKLRRDLVKAHTVIREGELMRQEIWSEIKRLYGVSDDGPLRIIYNWKENQLQIIDTEVEGEDTGIDGTVDSAYHVKLFKINWIVGDEVYEFTPLRIRKMSREEADAVIAVSRTSLPASEGTRTARVLPEGMYTLKGEYLIYLLKQLRETE